MNTRLIGRFFWLTVRFHQFSAGYFQIQGKIKKEKQSNFFYKSSFVWLFLFFFVQFNCVLLGKTISNKKIQSIACSSIEWLHALLGSKSSQLFLVLSFLFLFHHFFHHNSSLLFFTPALFLYFSPQFFFMALVSFTFFCYNFSSNFSIF